MGYLRQVDRACIAFVSQPLASSVLGLSARALMAPLFVVAGYHKLFGGYASTSASMDSMGISSLLLPLVILLELGGGLALLAGYRTRLVALLLALFCIAAALLFHSEFADKMQQIMFMKNFALAGGLVFVTMHGGGLLSIDAWVERKDRLDRP